MSKFNKSIQDAIKFADGQTELVIEDLTNLVGDRDLALRIVEDIRYRKVITRLIKSNWQDSEAAQELLDTL